MSMILGLTALTDATVARLLADPPLVWRVIAQDDGVFAEGEGLAMDVDKAWHGLHYLFTGTADGGTPPLNFLLAGERVVGDIDVGYGPARVLSSKETSEVHAAVAALTEDQLRSRFDPAAMTRLEIYPAIWTDSDGEDDPLEYLIEHARALKDFIGQAASRNQGLLIHLR